MQSKVTSGRLDKRQLNQTSKPLPAAAVTFLTVTVTNTVSEINGQLKRCLFLTFFTKTSSAADPYFGAVSLKVTISKLLQAVCVAQCTSRAFFYFTLSPIWLHFVFCKFSMVQWMYHGHREDIQYYLHVARNTCAATPSEQRLLWTIPVWHLHIFRMSARAQNRQPHLTAQNKQSTQKVTQ